MRRIPSFDVFVSLMNEGISQEVKLDKEYIHSEIEDLIKAKYDYALEFLTIYETKTLIVFELIVIRPEYRGKMNILLGIFKMIIEYSEKIQKPIVCYPSPDYGENDGEDYEYAKRLEMMYRRAGFVTSKRPLVYPKNELIRYVYK